MIKAEIIVELQNAGLSQDDIEYLKKLDRNESEKNYFLEKNNESKWLIPLKILHYFDPELQPRIIVKDGFINTPTWLVLYYLKNISQTEDFRSNLELQRNVLDIIENVSNFNFEKNQFNPYTNFFFAKLLSNIDNELITLEFLDVISMWFCGDYDFMIVTSEILGSLIPKFLENQTNSDDLKKTQKILLALLAIQEVKRPKMSGGETTEYIISGDSYWMNDFVKKSKYWNKFAETIGIEFLNELKSRLKMMIETFENTYYYPQENGTLVFFLRRKKNQLSFDVSLISNRNPSELQFLFLEEDPPGRKHLGQFEIILFEKDVFVLEFLKKCKEFLNSQDYNLDNLEKFAQKLFKSQFNGLLEVFYGVDSQYNVLAKEIIHEYFLSALSKKVRSSDLTDLNLESNFLEQLLTEKYSYFRRIFLRVTPKYAERYSEIFIKYLRNSEDCSILDSDNYGADLKCFLENLKLNEVHQFILLDKFILEFANGFELEADKNRYIQSIYAALKHISFFKTKHQKLYEASKLDYTLPEYRKNEVRRFDPKRDYEYPITQKEIDSMTASQIAGFISSLEKGDSADYPKISGTLEQVRNLIEKSPDILSSNLIEFVDLREFVISSILSSYQQVARNGKSFSIDGILLFVKSFLSRHNWNEQLKIVNRNGPITPSNLFYDIIDLIYEIIRNEKVTVSKDQMEMIKELVEELLKYKNLLKIELNETNEDYANITLNSRLGRLIDTYVLVVWREIKLAGTEGSARWTEPDRDFFETLLSEELMEAYSIFGTRLSFFRWFDMEWTVSRIELLSNITRSKPVLWKAFMNGYMWSGSIEKDLFSDLKSHFMQLMENPIDDNNHTMKGLAHNICVAYMTGKIELNSRFLSEVFENKFLINEMISYFWFKRHEIILIEYNRNDEFTMKLCLGRIRVLKFWRHLYQMYENKSNIENADDRKILSNLSKLIPYLFELNERTCKWIDQIVPYVPISFNTIDFVEDLNLLLIRSGDKKLCSSLAGEILFDLFKNLETFQIPVIKKVEIASILKFVKENCERQLLNKILAELRKKLHNDLFLELALMLNLRN